MYCKNCDCTYLDRRNACPVCGEQLLPAPEESGQLQSLHEDQLIERVRQAGGEIRFHAHTSVVQMKSTPRFPYFGFGEALEQRIEGEVDDLWIDLRCTQVGSDRTYRYPWRGYGFAWPSAMEGELCSNPVAISAEQVGRKMSWGFPFFGFGYAWAEAMSGRCGDRLNVSLQQIELGRFSRRRFPHRGFGYAWSKRFEVRITLQDG
jgi:hypothetical protein